ncbi:hypothetical protein J6590_027814, partial [Homalodisca vitripennis]
KILYLTMRVRSIVRFVLLLNVVTEVKNGEHLKSHDQPLFLGISPDDATAVIDVSSLNCITVG